MLQYKQGRFHKSGASFRIPEGFFVEPCPELELPDGFEMHSPDDTYQVIVTFDDETEATDAILNHIFDEEGAFKRLQPVAPLLINHLSGHYVIYRSQREQYYEARFQLERGIHLTLLIRTDNPRGIKRLTDTDELREILRSVRRE